MSFCTFSKEFNENTYTTVENKFIEKYLPAADGFAVKVYLYGLYLCQNAASDFTASSMAEVLACPIGKIVEAFEIWEDYDLVEILSREPFAVCYLPVKSALGRPKKIRYEQYADFNKELQRKMQRVGKFVSYSDSLKYMNFLEENNIQPQAFLLIAEYCVNKQGESVSPSYIFNKAKKFIRNGWTTYEQVERELSNYNAHENDVAAVFAALSVFRKADENDYALYGKWEEAGFSRASVLEAAKYLKRGTPEALDSVLSELSEKGKTSPEDVKSYLEEREMLKGITFRIGRKLGVKISNPAPYIDEYTEKWFNCGYEESSLCDVALFCLRSDRNDFDSMDQFLKELFAEGVVSTDSVTAYLKVKNDELKLFARIQSCCGGGLRKSAANLALVRTWRDWNFSDEMILEAAKRASGSGNPIPYMNKILSEWKHTGVTTPENIPDKPVPAPAKSGNSAFSQAVEAINAKADRERYYALLREKAQSVADKYLARANASPRFGEIATELKRMEIVLAKAEMFEPEKLPSLQQKKEALIAEKAKILSGLGLTEKQLVPQYRCPKCSDTGFLPDGTACDCYRPLGADDEEKAALQAKQ